MRGWGRYAQSVPLLRLNKNILNKIWRSRTHKFWDRILLSPHSERESILCLLYALSMDTKSKQVLVKADTTPKSLNWISSVFIHPLLQKIDLLSVFLFNSFPLCWSPRFVGANSYSFPPHIVGKLSSTFLLSKCGGEWDLSLRTFPGFADGMPLRSGNFRQIARPNTFLNRLKMWAITHSFVRDDVKPYIRV